MARTPIIGAAPAPAAAMPSLINAVMWQVGEVTMLNAGGEPIIKILGSHQTIYQANEQCNAHPGSFVAALLIVHHNIAAPPGVIQRPK